MEIEAAFNLSAEQNGARVCLPLSEAGCRTETAAIEAMIDIAFPKTYAG
jgi:hypothetical protein